LTVERAVGRDAISIDATRASTAQSRHAVVQEAYVYGVSTRSVDDLVQAMGLSGIFQESGLAVVRGDR
jgi:transposase-like protein